MPNMKATKQSDQAEAQIRAVETMEELVGRGDWEAATDYFTSDVLYKVGAREPAYGLEGVRAYMDWQNALVQWQGHTVRLRWCHDEVVVIEADSHFTRQSDGRAITIPCTDIYRMDGLRIREWRVYADTSPFHSEKPALDAS